MRVYRVLALSFLALGVVAGTASAQAQQDTPESNVTIKSVKAVGYRVGDWSTKVDLKGTELMSQAAGEAKVEARQGKTNIEVSIKDLAPPTKLGAEFLTYVLWVVTPDGRSGNTGEILINKNGDGKLSATTPAQTFSMIVTAEPYFAVRMPSEMVILENDTRKDTKGQIFPVNDFKLMKRAQYEKLGNPLAMTPDLERVPLQVYEARNAVEIAKSRGAEKDAPEILNKAISTLQATENALIAKADKKDIMSSARQTVQFAEDARALAIQRQDQARIAAEKEAAAAKARSEAEATAAEEAKRQAELAAARQAQMKAEADVAATKAKAEADALKAKEEAARAEAERAQKAAADLRTQLLEQFNRILETRDTPRGLVVNIGDVLFDFGKYDLRPEAREKLAKLSGIILAHPGLELAVEGHTDNVGSDELNQRLSEKRAETVTAYLIQQGLSEASVTARGFGESAPVADNLTTEGRQRNRRVEIVVSGEVIGAKIGK
ncbi:MAG: flagellar motor protein MotB [Acidobacteria bacterium]|nr:MAG: flagellar motor protein MotB [Acidobacteriota bacterium]